jgi:adenylate cyclase class 2
MLEVEAKYKVLSKDAVKIIEGILTRQGFILMGTFHEEDTYYNHPCRNFRETDEALRLRRRIGGNYRSIRLTYKGPRKITMNIKSREEHEVSVEDYDTAHTILVKLGFHPVVSIVKDRTIYRKDRCEVTIDRLKPSNEIFMEIECDAQTIHEIASMMKDLVEPEPRTYLEIVMEEKLND